ncbi:MAG: triose-phosphate isomerase [Beutenbergiaceae bacterium]
MTLAPITLGVSLKMYFSHDQTVRWAQDVADILEGSSGAQAAAVRFFAAPTYLGLEAMARILGGQRVCAQNVATAEVGAFTGEVSAAELAEIGVGLVEIGHAERRRLFHESDANIRDKCQVTIRHGMTPVLCVGEEERASPATVASGVADQVRAALGQGAGMPVGQPVIVAYEPWWAIGADRPAPADYVGEVASTVKQLLQPDFTDLTLLYGGSAGPGTLTELGTCVDGLFLGRFVHEPARLAEVVSEASQNLDDRRARSST